ncbi:hypothetical protein [Catenuloplanes japonicus]|uniref:hypothetical protein n=1 Tax=Catenuloplanes japonicus TaxID=33876 RepID=UPI000B0EE459|nr:hypothetical protein [Catenuloplanes japonicus]
MTSTDELERLVRMSDLHGRRGSHVRQGQRRRWFAALTVAAVLAVVTTSIVA